MVRRRTHVFPLATTILPSLPGVVAPNFGNTDAIPVTAVKSAGGSPFSGLEAPLHQEAVFGAPAGYAWLYPVVFCSTTLGTAFGLSFAASALLRREG